MRDELEALFFAHTGRKAESLLPVGCSGSNRKYCRISSGDISVIGVDGNDTEENEAFIMLSGHFRRKGLPVPEVYAVSRDRKSYIQEDLGDMSLFDAVGQGRQSGHYSQEETELLLNTVRRLPDIQFAGAEGLDFSRCYPEPDFCRRTVISDLYYFRFCFLKASGMEVNEARLDREFGKMADMLLEDSGNTFMYRDFQARNVMLKDGNPYFIDFQGGRRGPVYYDLASFVWQARARYPKGLRELMTDEYLRSAGHYVRIQEDIFRRRLMLFVLFRTLQVLGAYGFRGWFERKSHFLSSIPDAISNIKLVTADFSEVFPYLDSLVQSFPESVCLQGESASGTSQVPQSSSGGRLEVEVCSFSYRKGIPEDAGGNGGGYVFDCRAIHNPGKYEEYRSLTGMDREVAGFLEKNSDAGAFLEHVYALVDNHIRTYLRRGFTRLMICFGCTGGQHRSVYCAEMTAGHIASHHDAGVVLVHREQNVRRRIR